MLTVPTSLYMSHHVCLENINISKSAREVYATILPLILPPMWAGYLILKPVIMIGSKNQNINLFIRSRRLRLVSLFAYFCISDYTYDWPSFSQDGALRSLGHVL